MSAAEPADQAVRFTVDEARAIRGAFNVVCELLGTPGLEVPPGLPISEARLSLFDRLAKRFDNRIEAATTREGGFQETLQPAEAQAVRDVVGALEALLQDAGGQELLTEIGFLVRPDQPVDQRELEQLMDVINRIDPTGVREGSREKGLRGAFEGKPPLVVGPEPANRFFPEKEPERRTREGQLQRIERLRSELGDALTAADVDVDDLETEVERALSAQDNVNCNSLLVALAELASITARATAADVAQPISRTVPVVDDARRLVVSRLESDECLARSTLRDLRGAVLSISDPLEDDPDDVETRAFAALSDIRNAFEGPRGGGASDTIVGP